MFYCALRNTVRKKRLVRRRARSHRDAVHKDEKELFSKNSVYHVVDLPRIFLKPFARFTQRRNLLR